MEYPKSIAGHAIEARDSKCWRLVTPGQFPYWFYVTWSPGNISMHGDLGEIQATHYQAMKTWESAACWMNGAAFDYFMEKTRISQVYDRKGTAEANIEQAEEYAEEWDDNQFWDRLASLARMGPCPPGVEEYGAEWCADVKEEILANDDLRADHWYEEYGDAEAIHYTHGQQRTIQWQCMRKWADLVCKELAK